MQLCEESSECGALRLETIPDTEGCYLKGASRWFAATPAGTTLGVLWSSWNVGWCKTRGGTRGGGAAIPDPPYHG